MPAAFGHIAFTFGGSSYQVPTTGIYLWISEGVNEMPSVRGVDVIVPALEGRVWRPRIKDVHKLVLTGWVWGIGATDTDARAAFRANMDTIRADFSPDGDPQALEALFEDGSTRTLDARPVNILVNEPVASLFASVSIELVSVTPDWTGAGS